MNENRVWHSRATVVEMHSPKTWYKLRPLHREHDIVWQPREVVLDMHDDDIMNRVFTLTDHTLVIRHFRKGQN